MAVTFSEACERATSAAHRAGHYLVQDADLGEVMAAVNALRGQQQRPATLEMIKCAIS